VAGSNDIIKSQYATKLGCKPVGQYCEQLATAGERLKEADELKFLVVISTKHAAVQTVACFV
jgi:hypothetical protein